MKIALTPEQLAAIVAPVRTAGGTTETVRDIASLDRAQAGDLSFLGNPKYRPQVAESHASVILVPADFAGSPRPNQSYLYVANPSLALAQICARIEQSLWPKPPPGIHPSAVVASDAKVDPTAHVGPLCVIESAAEVGPRSVLDGGVHVGRGARIGEDCWLMPRVVLGAGCALHRRVRLQPGVVIGSDGFGYEFVNGRHQKVPQIGVVVVEDDVEIGANSTVDRARFGRTVIGEGTKIDNLVQVAHNVVIGKHCILCAQVGISGSTTLEDYVIMGGQAGAAGHITIAKGTKAGGRAGLTTDTEPGAYLNGNPAMPYMLERRLQVLYRRLPDLFKRLDEVEKRLAQPDNSL